ncbi:MAG TPA: hypothetical protein VNV87_04465 [Acidimicrobiales bacterium]|jgi:hypothetical protein|nr:hypothetical protein [Acidimicrobiales bacterium]
MPTKQIQNVAGAYGLSPDFQDYQTEEFQNNPSGTTRTVGDVVIALLPPNNTTGYYPPQVDGTTTAASVYAIGVVGEPASNGPDSPAGSLGTPGVFTGTPGTSGTTFVKGSSMPIVTRGIARINIAGNTVAQGAFLVTSTTTGVAAASATPTIGTVIAVALDPSTNAITVGGVTTIRAIIKGS